MLDYFDYMKNYKLNKHNYFLTKIDKLKLLYEKNKKFYFGRASFVVGFCASIPYKPQTIIFIHIFMTILFDFYLF